MLSTTADVLSIATAAPWLAVGVVCLLLSAWVYRQSRRGLEQLRAQTLESARAQGERIGQLEHDVDLLSVRRQQLEAALEDSGLRVPWWPPDGRRERREDFGDYTAEAPLPPVPAFSDEERERLARHRRGQ